MGTLRVQLSAHVVTARPASLWGVSTDRSWETHAVDSAGQEEG